MRDDHPFGIGGRSGSKDDLRQGTAIERGEGYGSGECRATASRSESRTNTRPASPGQGMFPAHDEQLRVHLLCHAARKVCRGALIHRNGDRAPKNAAEKCGDPFRRVASPKQDPVARADSARFKLPGALSRHACHIAVGPAHHAVARALSKSNVAAMPPVFAKVFDQGLARHGCAVSTPKAEEYACYYDRRKTCPLVGANKTGQARAYTLG